MPIVKLRSSTSVIFTLLEPKLTPFSIVAIHGLDTSDPTTWLAYKNGRNAYEGLVHWLKDDNMLPREFPDARFFTYDWHANTVHDTADDTLFGHAKTLIRELSHRVSYTSI